jgi:hypothetical protein
VESASTSGGASIVGGAGDVERGGLAQALTAVGISRDAATAVAWSDEMRLGLHGQVRRRWAPRGIKLRQRVEVKYQWRYLALAVSAAGALHWRWLENMKQGGIAETVSAWKYAGISALVWDSAPSHRAKLVRQVAPPLIALPPYSPELNPAERVFEELRRAVEGRVWGTVDAKVAAVDGLLQDLARSPERVQRLAGWPWIRAALSQLPLRSFPAVP